MSQTIDVIAHVTRFLLNIRLWTTSARPDARHPPSCDPGTLYTVTVAGQSTARDQLLNTAAFHGSSGRREDAIGQQTTPFRWRIVVHVWVGGGVDEALAVRDVCRLGVVGGWPCPWRKGGREKWEMMGGGVWAGVPPNTAPASAHNSGAHWSRSEAAVTVGLRRWSRRWVTGNVSKITGNVSKITRKVPKISGNVSKISGNVSKITGNVSKIMGDVFK